MVVGIGAGVQCSNIVITTNWTVELERGGGPIGIDGTRDLYIHA